MNLPVNPVEVFEWSRGFGIRSIVKPELAMYLWFLEWSMFSAVLPVQHRNLWRNAPSNVVTIDGNKGSLINPWKMTMTFQAKPDGAEMSMTIENKSGYDWNQIAAVVPCFNPGMILDGGPNHGEPQTPEFANENTWFLSQNSELLQLGSFVAPREIHYNNEYSIYVLSQAPFVWSYKWPLAGPTVEAGFICRESNDGEWVTGIAWDDFISVQGHNPWRCMHLSIRVGPLPKNSTKTIKGRMWLFPGTKEQCLAEYQRWIN